MVSEAREAAGLDVDDSHRIYLRPFSAIEVPAGAPPRVEPADAGKTGAKARRRPSAAQRGYVSALARMEGGLRLAAEKRLTDFFTALGRDASAAATPMLDAEFIGQAAGARGEAKADHLLVEKILAALDLAALKTSFSRLVEAHYLEVAKEVAKAGKLIGISGGLPDPVARAVAAAGGRRAGLIDLETQSRKALFEAIAEGRAEGEGAIQLAARIAEHVEAGPWSSVETRSITIARTETKFAQNVSTIEMARSAGTDRLTVFDGRLGPDRSDPDHIARDGIIVTADEAAQMAADEHPNGTLSFAPYFEIQEDE